MSDGSKRSISPQAATSSGHALYMSRRQRRAVWVMHHEGAQHAVLPCQGNTRTDRLTKISTETTINARFPQANADTLTRKNPRSPLPLVFGNLERNTAAPLRPSLYPRHDEAYLSTILYPCMHIYSIVTRLPDRCKVNKRIHRRDCQRLNGLVSMPDLLPPADEAISRKITRTCSKAVHKVLNGCAVTHRRCMLLNLTTLVCGVTSLICLVPLVLRRCCLRRSPPPPAHTGFAHLRRHLLPLFPC